jgi:uncharacterized protein DUF1501
MDRASSVLIYGETDEAGYNAVVDRASVHDLNTIALRLMGIDHLKLTHGFHGLDFRLTDTAARYDVKLASADGLSAPCSTLPLCCRGERRRNADSIRRILQRKAERLTDR